MSVLMSAQCFIMNGLIFSYSTAAVRSGGHLLNLQSFQRSSVFWGMASQFCGVNWTVPHAASVLGG